MKHLFIITILFCISFTSHATDPIKRNSYYVEFDFSYPFHSYYNQALFQKKGLGLGGAVSVGKRNFPFSAEYFYQSPITFSYRNNEVLEQYQEIGLRYNLNHLTYVFPYGVDPYLGLGLMQRQSAFSQYELGPKDQAKKLSSHNQKSLNYKLSGGIKFGNGNVTVSLHYDFLPGKYIISSVESTDLTIYHTMHLFSLRAGFRINTTNGKKIKCPRFNKKVKRTLSF